jgi:hypothetical protein
LARRGCGRFGRKQAVCNAFEQADSQVNLLPCVRLKDGQDAVQALVDVGPRVNKRFGVHWGQHLSKDVVSAVDVKVKLFGLA